jgi:hypothetical protein
VADRILENRLLKKSRSEMGTTHEAFRVRQDKDYPRSRAIALARWADSGKARHSFLQPPV